MIEKHVIYNHHTANESERLWYYTKTRISVEYELMKNITRNFQHQQLLFSTSNVKKTRFFCVFVKLIRKVLFVVSHTSISIALLNEGR